MFIIRSGSWRAEIGLHLHRNHIGDRCYYLKSAIILQVILLIMVYIAQRGGLQDILESNYFIDPQRLLCDP